MAPTADLSRAVVTPAILRPKTEKCFSRVISLQQVVGLNSDEVEQLNGWYMQNWRLIQTNGFNVTLETADTLKEYLKSHGFGVYDIQKLENFLNSLRTLYYGLRRDYAALEPKDVSKDKRFQDYFYTARENPIALNSCLVMSNLLWALEVYISNDLAVTCLVDVLLQAYPAALDLFISLGGVAIIKRSIDNLATRGQLANRTNYLLKCIALLNKLDISYKILVNSKIGVPINGLATAAKSVRLGIDYECNSDQVKLKATDLIKKWKAIRDASMPVKATQGAKASRAVPNAYKAVSAAGRVNKPKPANAAGASASANAITVGNENDQANEINKNSGQGDGKSFVLNILDSMMEQREKERQRKIALRNAQKMVPAAKRPRQSSDNAATSEDANVADQGRKSHHATPSDGDSHAQTPAHETNAFKSQGQEFIQGAYQQKTQEAGPEDEQEEEDTRGEIASLVDFFRNIKQNTEKRTQLNASALDKHSANAAIPAVATSSNNVKHTVHGETPPAAPVASQRKYDPYSSTFG